jgi:hypothetical protein
MILRSSKIVLAGLEEVGSDAAAQSMRFMLDAEICSACRFLDVSPRRLRDRAGR